MTNEIQLTAEEKIESSYQGFPFIFSEYGSFSGADFNLIYKGVKKDSKGVNVSGFLNGIDGDSKGVNVAGVLNGICGNSKGVNLAGLRNYSEGVDKFLIQYGTLYNIVKKANPDKDFVLNIGLFNKVGDSYCPIIQLYGVKNLPGIIKETFSRKKKGLENLVNEKK